MYGSDDEASYDTSQDNDEISAWIPNKDGYNDVFTVSRRNKDDFKINNISAHATTGGPLLLDDELYRREKLNDKPTQEQITAAVDKAQNIMDQMRLGTWKAEFTHVSNFTRGDVTEYRIHVVALPVFQGVPSLRRPQLGNLKSTEVYASNYYLTEADFEFSADSTLMDFFLYSPLDVKQTVNDNVKVMAMEDIVNRAKEQLSLSDASQTAKTPCRTGKEHGENQQAPVPKRRAEKADSGAGEYRHHWYGAGMRSVPGSSIRPAGKSPGCAQYRRNQG